MRIADWRPLPASIPLRLAVLCGECQNVTASKGSHCTNCGSAALVSVEQLLPKADAVDLKVVKNLLESV